ncbi:MAG TPA: Ku protein [Polyangia bacterium]|jgi:DNA end-binding protein Ku
MAMRSMASATISFGLVSIPVRLYSATEASASISFNLLHKADGSRLRQQYICIKEEVVVPREEMVKGYEFQKGEYVVFTPEELKELEETSTQTVDITEFVPLAKVDPIYFDKAYFLGPDKGGDKPYKLLARAMTESGRAALARYAARGKMYLVLVRPIGDKLVMQQLHYADEVRDIREVPVGDAEVREQELKLAKQLVEQIARETFNPDAYEDEVKKRVEEQIQRKVEGKEIALSPTEAKPAQIIDLMEALKASLAKQPEPPAPKKQAKRADAEAPAKTSKKKSAK